jgi:hypothetical protein
MKSAADETLPVHIFNLSMYAEQLQNLMYTWLDGVDAMA